MHKNYWAIWRLAPENKSGVQPISAIEAAQFFIGYL
jgi:hypothetical protein